MRKVLLVTPSLACGGPSRLLCLLAAHLPRDSVRVCVLGEPSPWCEEVRSAGVPLDVLGWRWPTDLRPLLRLRTLLARERPDVVHAFSFAAAGALLAAGLPPRALWLSARPTPGQPPLAIRWLLGRCRRVVAFGQAEADAWLRRGALPKKVEAAPPAVAWANGEPPARLPGLGDGARVLVAVGPFHRHKGFREAVWTLDILRCLYDDLHLVLVGTGPDEERVRRFARLIHLESAVHFTGPVAGVGPWLARAEVVWAPALRWGGRQAALDAMAAGRPVVASRLPPLAEVVADAQTGCLVAPADKADLARSTRVLLEDAPLREAMGAAGRARARAHFSPQGMAEAVAGIYQQR